MCGSVCAKDGSWEPCNYYIVPEWRNFRSGDGTASCLLLEREPPDALVSGGFSAPLNGRIELSASYQTAGIMESLKANCLCSQAIFRVAVVWVTMTRAEICSVEASIWELQRVVLLANPKVDLGQQGKCK